MATIDGHLLVELVGTGPKVLFTSSIGDGRTTHPYLAKNTEQLRDDLINVWQRTPEQADAAIIRLEQERRIDLTITVEEAYIRHLFAA